MGLGNKGQAIMNGISAFLMVLGTAAATIPGFVPDEIKYPLAAGFWFCGIIGFALKEAVGSAYADAIIEQT
jgi:hypothetical protein